MGGTEAEKTSRQRREDDREREREKKNYYLGTDYGIDRFVCLAVLFHE